MVWDTNYKSSKSGLNPSFCDFEGESNQKTARDLALIKRTRPKAEGLCCSLLLIPMDDTDEAVCTSPRLSYADDIVLWQQDTDIDKAPEALALLNAFASDKTAHITFSPSSSVLKKILISEPVERPM
ncbi:hypothetical protein PoB_001639100 [Plakobranchus ocellatus]|uniref:Reverse transcriptase domain-containing protein n=1 Tax=Plakobranchus ocellatus TaxID=259542 RepID=A0AAV3YRX2_9GAST|nr:hypothetical protein PoB_001639100 [Plakobranchus ocellatus]